MYQRFTRFIRRAVTPLSTMKARRSPVRLLSRFFPGLALRENSERLPTIAPKMKPPPIIPTIEQTTS